MVEQEVDKQTLIESRHLTHKAEGEPVFNLTDSEEKEVGTFYYAKKKQAELQVFMMDPSKSQDERKEIEQGLLIYIDWSGIRPITQFTPLKGNTDSATLSDKRLRMQEAELNEDENYLE